MNEKNICRSPEQTFALGEAIAGEIRAGDVFLLKGRLGAGKTLLTKGILHGLGFDVDEVTSPSFALVNLYKTENFNVYHIDLWRIEGGDAGFAVGLDEILDDPDAVTLIEWPERLGRTHFLGRVFSVSIDGDGDDPRHIMIEQSQ